MKRLVLPFHPALCLLFPSLHLRLHVRVVRLHLHLCLHLRLNLMALRLSLRVVLRVVLRLRCPSVRIPLCAEFCKCSVVINGCICFCQG
jgi:hypothetical protein